MQKKTNENILGIPSIVRFVFLSGCTVFCDDNLTFEEIHSKSIPKLHEFYLDNKDLIEKTVLDITDKEYNEIYQFVSK